MELSITKQQKNTATLIHASVFSKFLVPLGNLWVPILIWSLNKKDNPFVDAHGKQAVNFQLSLCLYQILLSFMGGLFFIVFGWRHFQVNDWFFTDNINLNINHFSDAPWLLIPIGIGGLLVFTLFMVNLVCTIQAIMKANEGQSYNYPLTIKFLK